MKKVKGMEVTLGITPDVLTQKEVEKRAMAEWLSGRKTAKDTRYVVFFDCFNSNPRGNYDDGNRPTTFESGRGTIGEVMPTTLKRCIRESIIHTQDGVPGMEVYIREGDPLGSKVDALPEGNLEHQMLKKFADARWFGGVVLGSKGLEKAESVECDGDVDSGEVKKGKKEKIKQRTEGLRGAVVVEAASTLDTVKVDDITITRCVSQKADEDKTHNVGGYSIIRYARYRFGVYVESFMAKKTGFDFYDQSVLETSLCDLYKYRRSAGRPSIRTKAVYKIEAKQEESNSVAMDDAMDAIQCKKVSDDAYITPSSYELPEVFENDFVKVTRIK